MNKYSKIFCILLTNSMQFVTNSSLSVSVNNTISTTLFAGIGYVGNHSLFIQTSDGNGWVHFSNMDGNSTNQYALIDYSSNSFYWIDDPSLTATSWQYAVGSTDPYITVTQNENGVFSVKSDGATQVTDFFLFSKATLVVL